MVWATSLSQAAPATMPYRV